MIKQISIKAVCVGVVFGFIGSIIASLLAAMFLKKSITSITTYSSFENTSFLILDIIFSCIPMFLTGYITAKINKTNTMVNVVIVAIILISLLFPLLQEVPSWYLILTIFSIFFATYVGAKRAIISKDKKQI